MSAAKLKRASAEQLIRAGQVLVNDSPLNRSHLTLALGDRVEIDSTIESPQKQRLLPSGRSPFDVLFQDRHLIVVNKPAGLLTVPTPKRESNTLQSQLRKWLKGQPAGDHAICVHRLDKLVSGLLVFARSIEVADLLRDQFASHKPDRLYRAFVGGKLKRDSGTIKSYLSTDDDLNRRSSDNPEMGELAITHFQLDQAWNDVSLVSLKLETGRRNQIRVHLADLGHPVLGDPRYGGSRAAHALWPFKRIALHAETLSFEHPVKQTRLRFTSNWPREFRELRNQLNRK
jgi:23S rRNA pseudouridine1911/1915/1917 synthase